MDDIYYHVGQSGKVQDELARLCARAIVAGRGREVLETLRVIDNWLRADPESLGEPTRDYPELRLTEYFGSYGPLAVTYTVHWDHRLVLIARPFEVLRWAGF